MTTSFSQWVLFFTVYSIAGWIVETIICSVLARRYVNRGFLGGPFCPLYGFLAVVAVMVSAPVAQTVPPLTFVFCIVALGLVKFFASWLLEKLFSIRLWDYSTRKLNIKGRVYWLDLLLMGLLGSAVVYLLQPGLSRLVELLAPQDQRVLASVLVGVYALGLYRALSALSRLVEQLNAIRAAGPEGHVEIPAPTGVYAGAYRLLDAYPHFSIGDYQAEIERLHDAWETSHDTMRKRLRKVASVFGHKTVETVKQLNPFAYGVSFHKLVWVFGIGCVLGYLIETAFCLVVRGVIESRQGMIYGPFNQVYGIGAVLMTLLLQPLAKKGDGWVFVGGALVGGVFEFVASWLQERVLGTVSWEYSDQAFSFGGRTSLLFMFFWGILGLVYIRMIYPRLSDLIERIPQRQGTFFSWVIIIALTANMAISFAAVDRWTNRQRGAVASNAYETFMDAHYPDEMMEEIYPSMMIVGEDGARPTRTNL